MNTTKLFCAFFWLACAPQIARADTAVEQAKQFFNRYMKLEDTFDPASADLFADSAVIRNTRKYPTGQTRVLTLKGTQFKTLIRQVMPLAKARNDRNRYSKIAYKRAGKNVKITAQRYSLLKQYTSPITIIVAPVAPKKWLIVEHYSESRPF